jgi:outer membrane protein insertion porin family
VEESIARMERLAVKKGFDFLRVEPRVTRNDRDLTLDVEFALTKGPKIFVERIDIKGNTTTLDQVIRRQFRTAEGDPFNPREIRQAAERIRALGYFKTADVNAREGSRPDQVVVDVDVEETTTGTLSFGLTFSSSTGVGASAGFSENNFLGRGQSLTAQVTGSAQRVNFIVDFSEPAFLGRDVEFGLNTSFGRSSGATNQFYDTKIAEFRPRLVFPVGENTRLGLFYFAKYSDIINYDGSFLDDPSTVAVEPNGILKLEELQNGRFASGFGYSFSFDTRRTGLNPTAGVLLSFSQELAGLVGDENYLRTTGRAVAQRTVFREDITLRATLEGGSLNYFNGQKSTVVERFSNQIMRGFEIGGMGPRQGREFLGGDYFAALKFEAEFPLGLPDEYGITGGVFYDIGSIWGLNRTNSAAPLSSTGFHDRHAAGVSLFWTSPFGPIRMNFSKAIKKQPGDIVQNFEFTVKTDF